MKRIGFLTVLFFAIASLAFSSTDSETGDRIIADFEGDSYGDGWTVDGTAFGTAPAGGTLSGQMKVSGFKGRGLVSSYSGGDKSIGTLTSPEFTIDRPYINFLIGGGGHMNRTCINLIIDGGRVLSARGFNRGSGGSENLDWQSWNVADFRGKRAKIQIVDNHTGGWGHINVDQIVLSDRKMEPVKLTRQIKVDQQYLLIPIKKGASKRLIRYIVDGKRVREFVVELAGNLDEVDFWAPEDMDDYLGKTVTIEAERMELESQSLSYLKFSDQMPGGKTFLNEKYRPQFHFTPDVGWMNDPNGMVYYDGEYHLFFQHNPVSTSWENMTWGHAVSSDMLHWKFLDEAIYPDEMGTIFSGSAVVDWNNSAGFQTGKEKALVAFYTSAGDTSAWSSNVRSTQSIAYSNDRGRSWTKFEGNPVLGHIKAHNRDPKVIWHEPSRQWVMALYLTEPGEYALYGSKDLKSWGELCHLPDMGVRECPDFFELAVDGDPKNSRWVFWGGDGHYTIGTFDGKTFKTEDGPYKGCFGRNDYAAQTFSDIPAEDGRRIQISWMIRGRFPGMPFNQQMAIPRVLTLRATADGVRMFFEPVEEVEKLRGEQLSFENISIKPGSAGDDLLAALEGDLFDVECTFEPPNTGSFGFSIFGHPVRYTADGQTLQVVGSKTKIAAEGGKIYLRILVDRTSIETFVNHGRWSIAESYLPKDVKRPLSIASEGTDVKIDSLKVWKLKSVWVK
jgi:fructan beta-fructosidase